MKRKSLVLKYQLLKKYQKILKCDKKLLNFLMLLWKIAEKF